MNSTGVSQYNQKWRFVLRNATLILGVGALAVIALQAWKKRLIESEIQDSQALWRGVGSSVISVFNSSYYFSRDESYVPEIRRIFAENPELLEVEHWDTEGHLIHRESREANSSSGETERNAIIDRAVSLQLKSGVAGARAEANFRVRWVYPQGTSSLVLLTRAPLTQRWVFSSLTLILLGVGVALWVSVRQPRLVHGGDLRERPSDASGLTANSARFGRLLWRSWPLWLKVFSLIFVVNVLTGLVLFESLSRWQTADLSARIRREALLLSRFSQPQIMTDFRNTFFDPSKKERFLKSVRETIAMNSDLERIRVISHKTGAVLFTSELLDSETAGVPVGEEELIRLNQEQQSRLQQEGYLVQEEGDFQGRFQIAVDEGALSPSQSAVDWILKAQSANQSLYWLEYRFGFGSLQQSIRKVRKDLFINLVPVLLISIGLALALARFLSEPIRQLIAALRGIGHGDFSVKVAVTSQDEIGELEKAFNSMTEELRRKQELKKYLSDATYRQIIESSSSTETKSEGRAQRLEAAVLFSDIRGFVSHCETSDAEDVLRMLNEYFAEMVTAIYAHGGEVDKFIGDAILAVFYVREEDHGEGQLGTGSCLRAIQAALEMKSRLAAYNQRRVEKKKFPIDIGIGISFGQLISGEMGTRERRDFTVIGDAVNVASRIEKFSKKGRGTKIVFSGGVETRLQGLVGYELLEETPVAGKEERIRVCELTEIREIQSLISLLKSEDERVRAQSLDLIAISRNTEAVEPLLAHVVDQSEKVRVSAIRGLQHVPPGSLSATQRERIIEALAQRLDQENSGKVLSALVMAFGHWCSDSRILKLAPFLSREGDDRLVANTVEALGAATPRYREVQDHLLPLLNHTSNRIRANVAKVLFLSGRHEVIASLNPMLLSSNSLMRASGAWAVGELATSIPWDAEGLIESLLKKKMKADHASELEVLPEGAPSVVRLKPLLAALQTSVPMLVSLLRDSDERVRRQAISALGKIQDRSALMPLIDSIDFEKDSRETLLEISQALRSIGAHRLVREVVERLT
jgi:class 3 adenylate cyclase/HEAT repeat protein